METDTKTIALNTVPLSKSTQGLLDAEKEKQQLINQMGFHHTAITEVKNKLGAKCTYLSHVVENNIIFFKANLLIKDKKKTFLVSSNKLAEDLIAEDYGNLNKILNGYLS